MVNEEIEKIAQFCKDNLDLKNATLGDEYYYSSLPLCVIDSVFSIGVIYTATRNTVIRFCKYFGIEPIYNRERQPLTAQMSITEFIKKYDECGLELMTNEVYRNRQKTSPKNGILKSDAVLRFSQVLQQFGVEYLRDVEKIIGLSEFEEKIKNIPGQKSGISLRYFYMLAGSEDFVKPDRMMERFILSAINKRLSIDETQIAITEAHKTLVPDYPGLTLKTLDHAIWNYQRRL